MSFFGVILTGLFLYGFYKIISMTIAEHQGVKWLSIYSTKLVYLGEVSKITNNKPVKTRMNTVFLRVTIHQTPHLEAIFEVSETFNVLSDESKTFVVDALINREDIVPKTVLRFHTSRELYY